MIIYFLLPYNYNQMASYIAHGASIENMVIAARHLGYQTQVSLFPDADKQELVATVEVAKSEAQVDPLYQAIFERNTNRFQFTQAEVTEEMLHTLSSSVKNIDSIKLSLVSQKDKINQLSKELMVNDRLVFERKDIHHFLFEKYAGIKNKLKKQGMVCL